MTSRSTSKFLFVLILTLACSKAFSDVRVNLMLGYKNRSLYRGAEIWPDPTYMIGPSFTFNNVVHLRGPTLSYAPFGRNAPFTFGLGIAYFDDGAPFFTLTDHQKDHRNKRPDSTDLFTYFGFNLGLLSLQFNLSKEIDEYKGLYGEAALNLKLIPFTTFNAKVGVGENSTNKYIFGPEAVSGAGHYSYGVSIMLPFLPWGGRLLNSFDQSVILKGENRHADYVRGRYSLSSYALRMMWSF